MRYRTTTLAVVGGLLLAHAGLEQGLVPPELGVHGPGLEQVVDAEEELGVAEGLGQEVAGSDGERSLAHEGPRLEHMRIEGARARVRFAQAEGLGTSDGEPPRGFTLAGPDGRHHPASAQIEASDVLLESPDVSEPRAVRYAFVDTLDANLENASGLPAAPFRTDPLTP